jgi:uncharacterized protein (DUF2147 family)
MKKNLLRLATAAALISPFAYGPSQAIAAEPVYGVWVRDGHPDDQLEFYDCAGKLCAKGTLPLPDGSPAPEILRNAAKNGANKWKGDLYNPEDGKTYGGEISYDTPTKLTLTGCLMGFLCQSEIWTRVPTPQKPAPETKAQEPQKEPVKELKEKEVVKPTSAGQPAKSEIKSEGSKTPASGITKPAAAGGLLTSGPKPAVPTVPKPSSTSVKPTAPAPAVTKPSIAPAKPAVGAPGGKQAPVPAKPALKPEPTQ